LFTTKLNQNLDLSTINPNYFEKAIVRLSADLGYYISNYDDVSTSKNLIESYSGAWLYQSLVTISDIYLKRAEVYKNIDELELMCEELNKVCETTDCDEDKYKNIKQRIAKECK